MTNLFQPLDLTVNGSAKAFMKRKFTEWYSSSIATQLDQGKSIEEVDVELKLSILKPLQANWIKELYDYMTSEEGREIISNVWKAATITEAIQKGTKDLESLDPFFTADPMDDNDDQTIEEVLPEPDDVAFFVTPNLECEDEEVWEFEGEQMRNVFDIFNDDL